MKLGRIELFVAGHPPTWAGKVFDRRVAAWRLPHLTIHGLRHTWATLALKGGVHPRVVQERLGHSTIAVTLDTYSHVSPTLHDEAARAIAAGFSLVSRLHFASKPTDQAPTGLQSRCPGWDSNPHALSDSGF